MKLASKIATLFNRRLLTYKDMKEIADLSLILANMEVGSEHIIGNILAFKRTTKVKFDTFCRNGDGTWEYLEEIFLKD